MYKVLIADDDVEILHFISHLVDWQRFGFAIVAKVQNGAQALEVLRAQQIDLLVTDINMPGITGLALIRQAQRNNPQLKSIVLTCHEEFSYAKEAISLGVCEYLVKYTLEQETLATVLQSLGQQMQQAAKAQTMQQAVQQNQEQLAEKLLHDLLHASRVQAAALRRQWEELDPHNKSVRMLTLIFLRDWALEGTQAKIREKSLMLYAMKNIACELLQGEASSVPYILEDDSLIIFTKGEPLLPAKQMAQWVHLQGEFLRCLGVDTTIVQGVAIEGIEDLSSALARAKMLRVLHFYPQDSAVVCEQYQHLATTPSAPMEYGLVSAIAAADYEGVSQQVAADVARFAQTHTDPALVAAYYKLLVQMMLAYFQKEGVYLSFDAQTSQSFCGYERLLEQLLCWYQLQLARVNTAPVRAEIEFVVQYIQKNMHEKITSAKIAKMIHMNPNYFSKFFKESVGKNFSEYLTEQRIERATMLLQYTNLPVEEITERLGLANMHYFYRLYKAETGKSPGDVRKRKNV